MKKFITAICTALLVVVLAFTLTGCDKSGKIKKAFEKEGYTVTVIKASDSKVLTDLLSEEDMKEIDEYEVFNCSKSAGLSSGIVTIIKFPSDDKLKEVLGEEAYNKAEEKGYVNGNCYLAVPLGADVVKIFKDA